MFKKKEIRHPRKKVVEAISEAFKEIEGHFELEGFAGRYGPPENAKTDAESEAEGDSEEDESSDEDFIPMGEFQREDIEVAIDLFISTLVQQKVIKQIDADDMPSLSEVFEAVFGIDHEIVQSVGAFEENIKGYFGVISYADMSSANGEVWAIRDIISRELNRNGHK